MKEHRAIVASYVFFLIANVTDILSSLGQPEANPLMRVDPVFNILFDPWKAVQVKFAFFLFYVAVSCCTYVVAAPLSRRWAIILAALAPAYSTFELLQVTLYNLVRR